MSNDPVRPSLQLYLLGIPTIQLNGEAVCDLPAKTQALLFHLAVTRQSHLRTTLATLLWGELPEQHARANLRKAIQQLRSVLPEHFHSDHHSATLHTDGRLWVDAVAFADQIVQAQKRNDFQALEQAIQLYRDDFLAGFFVRNAPDFDAWQLAQRERLREQMVGALETLAQHWTAKRELVRAIAITRRLLTLEPWREEAHRRLMQLLVHNGQREAALIQYERCREALHTELDVDPAAETTALYEQIRAGEKNPYPERQHPTIPVSQPHSNLPTPTTPLIGRAAEIAQLLQLLADPTRRLLSIVAPGGMGKSHLALAVAQALLPHCADGVFFIALAPLTNAETIVPTIAAAVGYTFQTDGRTPEAQLLDYLRHKELLLLLDNAEHLLASVTLFTEILQAAPKARLLVTSRERLRLSGETVFTLEGLATAGDAQEQGAAVELFLQTAQRVRPTFAPAATDWPAIQQICRLVGGMPLGLILAATWVELISPPEIATEISRSLDFLAADLHDMPERHHSLRAVFDTTWQRLSSDEQTTFQQLVIFQGGFTREAAERVADATLATLTALKHNALIQTQPNGRFEIHELLRQFALELSADQLADVRDKHSVYYCKFLAQREGDLKGAGQKAAMAEIEAESENIRMAWQWAVRRKQFDQLIDGIDSLGLFYLGRSRLDEGEALCHLALQQLALALPTDDFQCKGLVADRSVGDHQKRKAKPLATIQIRFAIRVLVWRSLFRRNLRQYESAKETLQQAQKWFSTLAIADNRFEQAILLLEEAELNEHADHETSHQLVEESLQLLRTLGDGWRAAQGVELMGKALASTGFLEQAWEFTMESLTLRQQLGDLRGVANSLQTLSNVARLMGRFEEAADLIRQSIANFKELDDLGQQAMAMHFLAGHLVHGGQFAESLQVFKESIALHEQLGIPGKLGDSSIPLCFALMHLGYYGEVRSRLQITSDLYTEGEHAYAVEDLGRVALAEEKLEEAHQYLLKALTLFRSNGDMNGCGQGLGCLGYLALRQQNLQQAQVYIYENLQIAAETRLFLPSMTALAGVALLRAATGDGAGAIELYTVALQHSHVANSWWYYDVVGRQIDGIAAKLSVDIVEAAQARGRARDWRATIQELWAEIEGDGTQKVLYLTS